MNILSTLSRNVIQLKVSDVEALIIVGIALLILALPFIIMRIIKQRRRIEKVDLQDFDEEEQEQ